MENCEDGQAMPQSPRFVLNLKKRLQGLGPCSCCSSVLRSFKMEILQLLDELKRFCSHHTALLSMAAVASTLIYWISGHSKHANIREARPRASLSSEALVSSSSSAAGNAGVSGLENVGRNWCYSNGLLQAMASSPVFCSWIEHLLRAFSSSAAAGDSGTSSKLHGPDNAKSSSWLCYGAHRNKMPLIAELNAVIRGVNTAHHGTGSLKGIYEALESHGWQISEGEHDSHEMLSVLCTTIQLELESVERAMGYTQKELKQHEKILSGNPDLSGRLDPASLLNVAWLPPAWQELTSDKRSGSFSSTNSKESLLPPEKKASKGHLEDVMTRQMVASVRLQSKHMPFGGFFANQLQCLACGSKHAARWDRFECISLQLPEDAPSSGVSLVSLLESYTSPDHVEGVTCDHCSKIRGAPTKRSFTKRITIGKLPELLVLHINRSVWTGSDNATHKRNDRVWYPMSLDMATFTYTHAVNNAVGQPNAVMDSVRGLSRLVETRFSARSTVARLPLTRKTASIASTAGVQTCTDEAESSSNAQGNSSTNSAGCSNATASVAGGPSTASPAKAKLSCSMGVASARLDKKAGKVSPSKSKESNSPKIVSPAQWFHSSDMADEIDSSANLEQSVFVSTKQPSLSHTNADIADRSENKRLPAETLKADNISNTVFTKEKECDDSVLPTEHVCNGAPSENVLKRTKVDCSASNGISAIGKEDVNIENVDDTISTSADYTLTSNVTNSCTNKFSVSNPTDDHNNTSSREKVGNAPAFHHIEDEKQSVSSSTAASLEESSSTSGSVTAPNGPKQGEGADAASSAILLNSESLLKDAVPSTSAPLSSESDAGQAPATSAANSASGTSRRNETSTTRISSARLRGSTSADAEHIALYQLRAVIVHSGSASSGHFTTYRRGPLPSSSWYFTSDETVRRCEMTPSIGTQPYMLFYERYSTLPPPASAAARLKSSLASLSSSLPFKEAKKTSPVVSSPIPLSSVDDTPAYAEPLPLAASNDAAYFSGSSFCP